MAIFRHWSRGGVLRVCISKPLLKPSAMQGKGEIMSLQGRWQKLGQQQPEASEQGGKLWVWAKGSRVSVQVSLSKNPDVQVERVRAGDRTKENRRPLFRIWVLKKWNDSQGSSGEVPTPLVIGETQVFTMRPHSWENCTEITWVRPSPFSFKGYHL